MSLEGITENSKAILLLCGRFGVEDSTTVKPLTIREYDELASWLQKKQLWPEDLLRQERINEMENDPPPVDSLRLQALLARGVAMAFAVERWTNVGLWIVCRSDASYPQRLKDTLKRSAPPILYGAGDIQLLSSGGIAVVGSRNVDEDGERFARNLGRRASECGMQVVSGAARGVDEFAMHGAFAAGGRVVGVVADSLLRSAMSAKYREGIMEGRLTLISPFNPETPFNVGNAMGRNKYIYALSDMSVVVSAEHKKGGTWAGAEEELKSRSGRPLFVRMAAHVPRGNSELLRLGGLEFPSNGFEMDLQDLLNLKAPAPRIQAVTPEPDLFAAPGNLFVREPPESLLLAAEKDVAATVLEGRTDDTAGTDEYRIRPVTALDLLADKIIIQLAEPKSADELAALFMVRELQMKDWLGQLIDGGRVSEKRIRRKRMYVATRL